MRVRSSETHISRSRTPPFSTTTCRMSRISSLTIQPFSMTSTFTELLLEHRTEPLPSQTITSDGMTSMSPCSASRTGTSVPNSEPESLPCPASVSRSPDSRPNAYDLDTAITNTIIVTSTANATCTHVIGPAPPFLGPAPLSSTRTDDADADGFSVTAPHVPPPARLRKFASCSTCRVLPRRSPSKRAAPGVTCAAGCRARCGPRYPRIRRYRSP